VIEDPNLGAQAEAMFLADLEQSRELPKPAFLVQGAESVKRIAME